MQWFINTKLFTANNTPHTKTLKRYLHQFECSAYCTSMRRKFMYFKNTHGNNKKEAHHTFSNFPSVFVFSLLICCEFSPLTNICMSVMRLTETSLGVSILITYFSWCTICHWNAEERPVSHSTNKRCVVYQYLSKTTIYLGRPRSTILNNSLLWLTRYKALFISTKQAKISVIRL